MQTINYQQPLYRPPSEADNLIVQVTIGCHYNLCSFCSMYKTKPYRQKTIVEIEADLQIARQNNPEIRRIFLADGDAFNLEADHLMKILSLLHQYFPKLSRVSCYATPANINAKSKGQLKHLKSMKLTLLYVGVESGNDYLLKKICKGATSASISRALMAAAEANIRISATVILGLGGTNLWKEHIKQTSVLLNNTPVTYLSTLQLNLDKISSPGFHQQFNDSFVMQDDTGILKELKLLLQSVNPDWPIIFRSNHSSNALALSGNLPREKHRLLNQIEAAQTNSNLLTPEYLRRL